MSACDDSPAGSGGDQQQITIRYRNQHLNVPLPLAGTLKHLKRKIEELTGVSVDHQKLLGLTPRMADDAPLPRVTKKLMLINAAPSAAAASTHDTSKDDAPKDDAPSDDSEEDEADAPITNNPDELRATMERRIATTQVTILNPPRLGAHCLVLDIDYTLFDLSSSAERAEELARPGLHEFLSAAYALNFDLLIWSATSIKWVELKMRELGCLSHAEYQIVCMLDAKSMLTVHSHQHGVYNCKPLAFVWAKFEGVYGPANTLMVDDLRRNYVLNPQNGLVIKPYRRRAHKQDRELMKIKTYLESIAGLDSFAHLDHDEWASYRKR